jgi:hypothetical protein
MFSVISNHDGKLSYLILVFTLDPVCNLLKILVKRGMVFTIYQFVCQLICNWAEHCIQKRCLLLSLLDAARWKNSPPLGVSMRPTAESQGRTSRWAWVSRILLPRCWNLDMTAHKIVERSISQNQRRNEPEPEPDRSPILREMKIPLPINIPSPIGMKSSRPRLHPGAGIDPSPLRLNANYKRKTRIL